jgi:aryl carrier-like protein
LANAITDGDKEAQKYYQTLMEEALLLEKNGKILKESVVGVDSKSEFQQKYNTLLMEEERLRDEGLANGVRWEGLEANLIKQRSIIQDKESTSLEKANAVNEAEKIAAQLLKEKGEYVDRELTNVTAIAEMTQTQEVVEEKVADLQKQKNTIQKDYGLDMIKVLRMESRASKEAETQVNLEEKKLKLLKDQQTTLSTGTDLKKLEFLSPTDYIMKQNASINAGGATPIDTTNLIPFQYEQTGVIQDTTTALQEQQMVLLGLSDQFAGFFTNIDGGFEGMIDGVIQGVQRLVTELLAKAAILAILTAITGGTVSGATFAPMFKGLDFLKGSASVGNVGSLQGVSVVGKTVVSGRDLNIVWQREQNNISMNT